MTINMDFVWIFAAPVVAASIGLVLYLLLHAIIVGARYAIFG